MALCEDESCGLARVASDDRIVPWRHAGRNHFFHGVGAPSSKD
jgi:hypothetical protein